MKFVITILVLFVICSGVFAQDDAGDDQPAVIEGSVETDAGQTAEAASKIILDEAPVDERAAEILPEPEPETAAAADPDRTGEWFERLERFHRTDGDGSLRHFAPVERSVPAEADPFTATGFDPLIDRKDFEPPERERFHWKAAFAQSMIFLGIQHGSRLMVQPKTRNGLKGPFFKDWGASVRGLRGWDDGGIWFTNYVAHPLQGGVTGHIFVNNSDRARRAEFGDKVYWETRFKAFVWSALWSAQFELGPLSEASIGNVGMTLNKKGKTGMAWVDLVVTPVGGTAELVVEDLIDKYVLENWIEKNTTNRTRIKFWRTLLNPTRSFANILRWKPPWKRDRRPF